MAEFTIRSLTPQDQSRKIKPQIPLVGLHGIPLRDEIELEMALDAL